MRIKTPLEKKQLSYARDGRSVYDANEKESRKSVPLAKKRVGRAYRKLTRPQPPQNALRLDTEAAEAPDAKVRGARRKSWTPQPDMPLGKLLVWKRRRVRP